MLLPSTTHAHYHGQSHTHKNTHEHTHMKMYTIYIVRLTWFVQLTTPKSAVMVFSVEGGWKWGEHTLLKCQAIALILLVMSLGFASN